MLRVLRGAKGREASGIRKKLCAHSYKRSSGGMYIARALG